MARLGRPKLSKDVQCRCTVCGKTWLVPEWRKTGRLYCSRACFHRSRAGKPRPDLRVEPAVKVCAQCGQPFQTGGTGRPPRTATYCSRACLADALTYQPPPRELSDLEAAWLAGVFDGEGNVCPTKGRPARNIRISVPNTCEALVRRLAEVTATGSVAYRPSSNPRHRDQWVWRCYGKNALTLLRRMLPWLIVKRAEALVALREESP